MDNKSSVMNFHFSRFFPQFQHRPLSDDHLVPHLEHVQEVEAVVVVNGGVIGEEAE